MCGIAGVFDYRSNDPIPLSEAKAVAMVDTLIHRGPDDGGLWIAPGIMLGHRRLSILDVSSDGHQPMFDVTTGCAIAYNGEIYNFRQLRDELRAIGVRFHSNTDTEVLLQGYVHWGHEIASRLRGMFAFAIYDPRIKGIWLVRDGIGIKPLFVHDDGQRVWFASEIKAILSALPHLAKLDRQGISRFLAFGYTPAPWTGFEAIQQIKPGEWLLANRGGAVARSKWYRFPYPDRPCLQNMDDAANGLDHAIGASVARHLVSDVPIGAMLSGGLDSSMIVRCMTQTKTNRVETFSAGFDEVSFDERAFARQVADRYGTQHQEVTLDAETRFALQSLVCHAEEPLADNSAIPLFRLSEFTRRSVTVALSGDGADELLAGYDTYRASQMAPWYRAIPRWFREGAIEPSIRSLPDSVSKYNSKMMLERFVSAAAYPAPLDHAMWRAMVSRGLRKELFLSSFLEEAGEPWKDYTSVLDDAPDWLSPLEQQLHMDLRFHLPNGLLVKSDRMSMAHGLEVRVPFLDHDVIACCLQIPPGLKRRGKDGKRVLKTILAKDLPRSITHRKKAGFVSPLEAWMRDAWQPFLRIHITEQFANESNLFHWSVLSRMMDEQKQGKDHAYALYTILVLSLWWQTWIAGKLDKTICRPRSWHPTQVRREP
jgi:asparagine synthase (glutamine-hydrolysing)